MHRVAEPYIKVAEAVNAFAAARILHVAVDLDVFTKLANDGKTAAQLSTVLNAGAYPLELLLNALTAMGFLRKEAERFFDLPVSHTYLSKTGPKYMGHLIAHLARRWNDWGQLDRALLTGRPVRETDMYQEDPAELEHFIRGMHELALARGDARYLSRAIPLGRCRKLLDLGGGPGTYASMFCHANENLEAVVMDLPATLKVTRKILREFDRTGRVATQAGDYRTDKIKGAPYDVVLISNILHSEDEETNRGILARVLDALVPGGIVIIKDHVLNADHTSPEQGAIFALHLLLTTRGRTYSFHEIEAWMNGVGFQNVVQIAMEPPMNVSLVLALRPGTRPLAVLPKPAATVPDKREQASISTGASAHADDETEDGLPPQLARGPTSRTTRSTSTKTVTAARSSRSSRGRRTTT